MWINMVVPVMEFSGGSSEIGYDRDCINKNDTHTEKTTVFLKIKLLVKIKYS